MFRDENVTGIGMRHVGGGKVCLCIEVKCPRCRREQLLAILSRPMDMRAFIAELAELGGFEDYRTWALKNSTLKFYAGPPKDRATAVHHLETDGEGWGDQLHTELRLRSVLGPTGVVLHVFGLTAFSMRRRLTGDAELEVLGGYQSGDSTILMCRLVAHNIPACDGLLKVPPKARLLQRGFAEERLEPADWTRFNELLPGAELRLGGRTWKKLDTPALSVIVGTEVWTVRPPARRS